MDLMTRRRALLARIQSGSGLPVEYQEVEYLESTGTQYIALGLNGALDNGCFLLKFMFSDNTPGNSQLAGSEPSNNSLPKISFESSFRLNLRQSANNFVGQYSTSTLITLQTDSALKVYVNGAEVGAINNVTTVGNGYNLFSVYPNLMQYAARARIYNFKVWDNTSEKIDLVPCYRKSDSKPGMYDLITNTFSTNAGTGEFVVGANA